MEVIERVVRLEEHSKEQDRRIEKIESMAEDILRVANGVERMVEITSELKEGLKENTDKISVLEDQPGKLSIKAWFWVAGIVGSGVLGYVMSLIIG